MKTKTSLWLGVCTLVLCLGVMTFGVYSAISANLNIGGSLGFNMHNCMVTVSGSIKNVAVSTDNWVTATPVTKTIERTIMGGDTTTTTNMQLDDLYFYQKDSTSAYDIIFEISFKNVSSTAIKATIPAPTVGNGVTLVTDSASGYTSFPVSDAVIAINDTYTVKFALRLNSLDALANNVNFNWNGITFEEYVKPLQGNNIKYNLTANNATVDVTSTKVGYSTGGTSYQTTRQNILMDTDNTIRVTNTNTDGKGTTAEVNVGTLNFSDTNPIQPIVLTLTATNKSSTKVSAMIVIDKIVDATYIIEYAMGTNPDAAKTAYEGAVILDASTSVTFTITLTSTNPKEPSTNGLIISADFTKYNTTIPNPYTDEQGLIYTLNSNKTAWSVMGGDGDDEEFDGNLTVSDVIIADEIFGLPVTTIPDYAFGAEISGSDISTIYIPNTITSIGDEAFRHCTRLTSVSIGNSVTSIGDEAFGSCISLTSVSLGNSVTSIGDWAFHGCHKLVEVINKSKLTLSLGIEDNGYVAYYAKQIITDENDPTRKLSTDANGYLIYDDIETSKKILVGYTGTQTELTLPSGIDEIYQYALYNCSSLTSVTIPDSVTSIGDGAFYGINENAYTKKDNVKYLCNSKNECVVLCGVTDKTLGSYTIDSKTKFIHSEAFYWCTSLTSITIPNSVTSIGGSAFYDCDDLTSVSLGNSVTSIGSSAFSYCRSLTSVTIPDSVTSIGDRAFAECSSLTSITIPDSVTSIGDRAFYACTSLTSITIPDSVTSIGVSAFSDCTSLTSINIPDSVTSIGIDAFDRCSSLTSVYIDGATALSTAVSNYSSSDIFDYTTAVYIQKDVNMSGYTKFTKQGTGTYSYNGKTYYKYTESY